MVTRRMMFNACELVWPPLLLAAVHQLILDATGQECPCRRGERSPFLPRQVRDGGERLPLPEVA